jgi:hypothetical protein
MAQNTDQVGPRPYGPDQFIRDVSALLTDHGFAITVKATATAELRWHAASLLHLLLGGSPWESPGPEGA